MVICTIYGFDGDYRAFVNDDLFSRAVVFVGAGAENLRVIRHGYRVDEFCTVVKLPEGELVESYEINNVDDFHAWALWMPPEVCACPAHARMEWWRSRQ